MSDTEDFAALLHQTERKQAGRIDRAPEIGDRVRGVVVSIAGDDAFVVLGTKSKGTIALCALERAKAHWDARNGGGKS